MPTKRTAKIQICVDEEELDAIDTWRFENHMPSRSAAVRAMLHVALNARGAKPARPINFVISRDVGVVESSPNLQAALGTGARKRVLLVEDEYLIAAGLEMILDDLGYEVLGPVSRSDEATRLLDEVRPDAAVLDYALGSETSLELAKTLMQKRVPLAFCTGVDMALPEDMRGVPVITKPHVEGEIAGVLEKLVGSAEVTA